MQTQFIFDVESNGLHGEGFAVGWVLVQDGEILSEGFASCAVENVDPWVKENVLPHLPAPTQPNNKSVRSIFWEQWLKAKDQGAIAWADCGFPVETNFLTDCVKDDPSRMWQGPYPLHEISTVFEMAGWDSTAKYERLEGETAHHPLGDSRQSARLLNLAMQQIKK
jgi:hypothetical protein